MKITVIGTGYVGLITGLGFAEVGHSVLCYDNDTNKIKSLSNGVVPIYEAGANELLDKHLGKRIGFTDELQKAANFSDVIFICTAVQNGTAKDQTETSELIHLVTSIVKGSIAKKNSPLTFVIKSTAPVGTHDYLENYIQKKWPSKKIELVTNPEFLSEGEAISNFMSPYRIIVGTKTNNAEKIIKRIYSKFKTTPFLIMSPTSAEMTKHSANAMLATKISFINEIARLSDKVGADIQDIKRGLGLDPRIGPHFINPGPGYGGSCLPKDVAALVHLGQSLQETPYLLKAVGQTNNAQIQNTANKIKSMIKKNGLKTITVWGVSYKAETDDIRSSQAVEILKILSKLPIMIRVHDPAALKSLKNSKLAQRLILTSSLQESIQQSELIAVLTEWNDYKNLNFKKIKSAMKKPLLFDSRYLYSPEKMKSLGFNYQTIGQSK